MAKRERAQAGAAVTNQPGRGGRGVAAGEGTGPQPQRQGPDDHRREAVELVPQALVLTAIVIGFGITAFALVLFKRAYQDVGADDVDQLRATSARRVWVRPARSVTRCGAPPSTRTTATPRPGPREPTQVTARPVKRNVALADLDVDTSSRPANAPRSERRSHPRL